MKNIEIITERLCLKPLGSEYLQTVNAYAMDYENTKYMCRLPNEDAEETVNFLANVDAEWAKEQPAFYEFAILYQNEQIGAVSICFENGIGELGMIRTGEYGGRRNRSASEDSFEYQYELSVQKNEKP